MSGEHNDNIHTPVLNKNIQPASLASLRASIQRFIHIDAEAMKTPDIFRNRRISRDGFNPSLGLTPETQPFIEKTLLDSLEVANDLPHLHMSPKQVLQVEHVDEKKPLKTFQKSPSLAKLDDEPTPVVASINLDKALEHKNEEDSSEELSEYNYGEEEYPAIATDEPIEYIRDDVEGMEDISGVAVEGVVVESESESVKVCDHEEDNVEEKIEEDVEQIVPDNTDNTVPEIEEEEEEEEEEASEEEPVPKPQVIIQAADDFKTPVRSAPLAKPTIPLTQEMYSFSPFIPAAEGTEEELAFLEKEMLDLEYGPADHTNNEDIALKGELHFLRMKSRDLEQYVEDKTQELMEVVNERDAVKSDLEETVLSHKKAEDELKQLKEQLKGHNQTIEELTIELESKQTKIDEFDSTRSQLRDEVKEQLRSEFSQELKARILEKMRREVRDECYDELSDEIEEKYREQLLRRKDDLQKEVQKDLVSQYQRQMESLRSAKDREMKEKVRSAVKAKEEELSAQFAETLLEKDREVKKEKAELSSMRRNMKEKALSRKRAMDQREADLEKRKSDIEAKLQKDEARIQTMKKSFESQRASLNQTKQNIERQNKELISAKDFFEKERERVAEVERVAKLQIEKVKAHQAKLNLKEERLNELEESLNVEKYDVEVQVEPTPIPRSVTPPPSAVKRRSKLIVEEVNLNEAPARKLDDMERTLLKNREHRNAEEKYQVTFGELAESVSPIYTRLFKLWSDAELSYVERVERLTAMMELSEQLQAEAVAKESDLLSDYVSKYEEVFSYIRRREKAKKLHGFISKRIRTLEEEGVTSAAPFIEKKRTIINFLNDSKESAWSMLQHQPVQYRGIPYIVVLSEEPEYQ
ncbi:hypothetical protein PCE1_001664 [Barthelona sp. PCE]